MARTRASAKAAGSRTERAVADYLAQALDDDRIDRRVKTGAKDRGDIAGVRVHGQRVAIEVKDVKHEDCTKCQRVSGLKLPEWTGESAAEANNDGALVGVVVHKRNGTTDPGKFWVHMTLDDLLALITGRRHGHRAHIQEEIG
ncbi:holliday junction resolvase [Mycobacterium phage Mask]|nr:holliday junction resolvase [Mycobacterium phage Mask]